MNNCVPTPLSYALSSKVMGPNGCWLYGFLSDASEKDMGWLKVLSVEIR